MGRWSTALFPAECAFELDGEEAIIRRGDTIEQPYEKRREQLFSNPLMLPEFELQTIKAVQSIANNKTPFATWFDALGFMKDQISSTDFDIAIIGCGAYGMPRCRSCARWM